MPTLAKALEQQRMQEDLARFYFQAIGGIDWSSAWFFFCGTKRSLSTVSSISLADGSPYEGWGPKGAGPKWSELRQTMSEPDKGAWLTAELSMKRDGSFEYDFNYERRPNANSADGPFILPSSPADNAPSDEEWLEDLAEHPRAEEYLPEWMQNLKGARGVEGQDSFIPRALGEPISWPDEYVALADRWGWKDVWASSNDHLVRRLRAAGSPAVEVLGDESQRERWGRAVSQLGEDVFGDVYAELLARRDVRILVELWREVAVGLGWPEPEGVAALDGEVPVGPLGTDHPDLVEKLIDDVSDVFTAVIDKQLHDRFGVWPD